MNIGRDHQLPEAALVDVSLAHQPFTVEAESLKPPIEIEAGRGGSDEQECARLVPSPLPGKRLEELRDTLAHVHVAEAAEHGLAADCSGRQVGNGKRWMRDDPDRPEVPGRAGSVVDIPGMDDEAGGEPEHLPGKMEVLGPVLPERRDALVEDGVAEKPAYDTALSLHRVEVAVPVTATDRQTRDQVMQDEVVEDDDTRSAPERLENPAVSIRIVANMVDREIGSSRRLLRPSFDDGDLDPLAEGRK